MKRILLSLLTLATISSLYAQPKSINYEKENDFFMNVIYNPTFNLYNFLQVGLNSKNTDLKEITIYANSQNAKNQCAKLNISISEAYKKVKACWTVFLEVENTDISADGFGKYMVSYSPYNIFAPKTCPNPELKHKLSIVPLKLEKY